MAIKETKESPDEIFAQELDSIIDSKISNTMSFIQGVKKIDRYETDSDKNSARLRDAVKKFYKAIKDTEN